MPLALVVMAIYFHRLAVYKLPPHEVIVSVFLPLGPMGQGGYGIMELGKVALKIFPETETLHPAAGEIMYVLGFGVAIVMWGFGLVWLFFALASILSRQKFPFNMGWWGFTFPIGVFAMATITLGQELPSSFFRILGTVRLPSDHSMSRANSIQVFGSCVMLLWFVVAAGTVKEMARGRMIEAPCLRELERASQRGAEKGRQEA